MKKILFVLLLFMFTACADTDAFSDKDVDVDLTILNATMRSAELTNIFFNEPNSYIGKTIRASGIYIKTDPDENNEIFHLIYVTMDECCAPYPILFFPGDNFNFPAYGEEFEIVGIFNEYHGFDFEYYCLVDASAT